MTRWRWPLAVAASLLVALFVYRYAERAPAPMPTALAPQIAALDAASLAALHELVRAVVPQDDYLRPAGSEDEAWLAALPLADWINAGTEPPVPQATDLSENELDIIHDLLGGVG